MVRKKKEIIKPVVAKPLNDNSKKNLVTSFVTNNINEIGTGNGTNKGTNIVSGEETKNVTDKIINSDTDKLTNNDTKKVNKSSTKNVTKKVTIVKTISICKKDIVAKFTSDKRLRPNYNLSEDTVEKIEKISDILGYKKAEFVDIYLNGTLEKLLKNLEKSK